MKKVICQLTLTLSVVGCSDFEQPTTLGREDMALARSQYLAACAICHGKFGKGNGVALPALSVKPKLVKTWQNEFVLDDFIRIVRNSESHPDFGNTINVEKIYFFSRSFTDTES